MNDDDVSWESKTAADRYWSSPNMCGRLIGDYHGEAGLSCLVHAMGSWYEGWVMARGPKRLTIRYVSGSGVERVKKQHPWEVLPGAPDIDDATRLRCRARMDGWIANDIRDAFWKARLATGTKP